MKLCAFKTVAGSERFGIVAGQHVTPVRTAQNHIRIRDYLEEGGGADTLIVDGDPIGIEVLQFLPAVPSPRKIFCIGYNFPSHAVETGAEMHRYPTIFLRYAETLIGHCEPMVRPKVSPELDWEGELAAVIGKAGRHISSRNAMEHVFGYACFGDHSVRDYQRHSTQATAGKNFMGTGSFGPWLVTADEFGDPKDRRLQTFVNDELFQDSGLDAMHWSVADIVAYISTFIRLDPGDVIAMGTPAGIGMRQTPPRWLVPGDRVSVMIDGIGTLTNVVADEA